MEALSEFELIDRFFRPFCASFFLERDLVTSSRLFRFGLREDIFLPTSIPRHSGIRRLQ